MMEYQFVPNRKHDQTRGKKQRAQECCKRCDKVTHNGNDGVYILQPMLKLPKSTREMKSLDDETSIAVNAVKASNTNTTNNNNRNNTFNHFTMSRKGLVKGVLSTNMSRCEDPWNGIAPTVTPDAKSPNSDRPRQLTINVDHEGLSEHQRRSSCYNGSTKMSKNMARRASAGDALLKNNNTSLATASHVLDFGPDEVLVMPQRRQDHSKSNQSQQNGYRSPESHTNKIDTQQDDTSLKLPANVPRRKSFHDWHSMRQWYCPDERPVSGERRHSERRNVISPDTLSRIIPPSENKEGSRQGSPAISVCTEGDMMSYNFNLPSRRLISHKELKGCRLPYSDNIGLEETVSSDQARKGAKLKVSMEVKKKHESNKQTPKQVWYRTVRSILAANHLYHHVKNKNKQQ